MTNFVNAPGQAPAQSQESAGAPDEMKPLAQPLDVVEVVEALPEQMVDAGEVIAHSADLTADEARVTYDRLRTATEEAVSSMEAAFLATGSGLAEFNQKAIDAARASTDAMFDLVRAMAGAKTMSQMVELQTEHVRKQFEAANAQTKEFAELAARVSARASAPLRDTIGKAFGQLS